MGIEFLKLELRKFLFCIKTERKKYNLKIKFHFKKWKKYQMKSTVFFGLSIKNIWNNQMFFEITTLNIFPLF